jgi:hypothetical protein
MKNLARPSFFRMFDLLLAESNPGQKRISWTRDGVDFGRERHSVSNPAHGFVVEIVTLKRPGRRGWSLMVVKEYWWTGPEATPFKTLRWARALDGRREDMFDWLRTQEAALERSMMASSASLDEVEHS